VRLLVGGVRGWADVSHLPNPVEYHTFERRTRNGRENA
jgi:hypothetical protein